MLKSLFGMFMVALFILATTVGSVFLLGYIAFGNARCSGIDPFAAMALGVIGAVLILAVGGGIDMLSDLAVAKAATKGAQTNMDEMQKMYRLLADQARAMGAQASAQKRMDQTGPAQGGGFGIEDEVEFEGPPMVGMPPR